MRKLTLRAIEREICKHFECMPNELHIRNRKRKIINRRQLFHYFAYQYSKHNYGYIGNYGGGNFDRVTVLHSCNVVKSLVEVDKNYRADFLLLDQRLKRMTLKKNDLDDIKFDLKYHRSKVKELEELLSLVD